MTKCPYAHLCKYYDKTSYTCNDTKEDYELYYCGYYREHTQFRISEKINKYYQTRNFFSKRELAGE